MIIYVTSSYFGEGRPKKYVLAEPQVSWNTFPYRSNLHSNLNVANAVLMALVEKKDLNYVWYLSAELI